MPASLGPVRQPVVDWLETARSSSAAAAADYPAEAATVLGNPCANRHKCRQQI